MESYTINGVTTYAEERDLCCARCWITDYQDLDDIDKDQNMFPLNKMKRGDLLMNDTYDERYRNENVYIFDGEKLLDLPDDYSANGNIPMEFTLNEFNVDYFNEVLCGGLGDIRWLFITKELRREMIQNIQKYNECYYTTFELLGDKLFLFLDDMQDSVINFEEIIHNDLIFVTYDKNNDYELDFSENNQNIDYLANKFLSHKVLITSRYYNDCKNYYCCDNVMILNKIPKYFKFYNFKCYGNISDLIYQFHGNRLLYCKKCIDKGRSRLMYLKYYEREVKKIKKILQ